jgi:hypothetical protein
MSYNGQLNFGLLADSQALPELDRLADWVDEATAELLELALRASG